MTKEHFQNEAKNHCESSQNAIFPHATSINDAERCLQPWQYEQKEGNSFTQHPSKA